MPLVEDLQARVETDLPEDALQALLDEATTAIELRCGPPRDPGHPLTVTMRGGRRLLRLLRRLDPDPTLAAAVVVEHTYRNQQGGEWWPYGWDGWGYPEEEWWYTPPDGVTDTATVLADDDWRALNGGYTLQRLPTGTHPRWRWGQLLEVSYVPVDDTPLRDEVAIKLAILALDYDGAIERRVGDVTVIKGMRSASGPSSPLVYADERERLFASLQPAAGVELR